MEEASVRIRFRSLGNSSLPVCSNPSNVILHSENVDKLSFPIPSSKVLPDTRVIF